VADAAALATVYADRLLVGATRDVHRAVSGRVLRWTGQTRTPVGRVHDGINAAVYGGVGLATRAIGRAVGGLGRLDPTAETFAGRTVAPRVSRLRRDIEASGQGRRMRSIVNGLIGDVLHDERNALAITASVRHPRRPGHDVTLTPDALSAAYPAATGRLVVFVHGLCEDDEAWSRQRETTGPSYLEILAAGGRWTPVALRFNSGRPIRDTATEVAQLVDRLVDAWPVRVEEIALVGHSMGGLVLRAAAAEAHPTWWSDLVSHIVLLGSPHAGAPLERLVNRSVPLLERLPEVAPFTRILDERSVGIRNLHDGIGADNVVWPRAAYHCVGATLGTSEKAWAGRIFGDLLVHLDSARGAGAEVDADFRQVTGAHHFDLLNHPENAADLLRWLTPQESADG
jgi:pimeloyl-ACP methyl ester carboxylesterase